MIDLAVDNAVFLQLAKLQRQHTLGNARADPPEFIKALSAVHQMVQQHPFPFSADYIKGKLNGTGLCAIRAFAKAPFSVTHICSPHSIILYTT
ncbi:hypothetical protein D3C76_1671900 [compost metagenome]